MVFIRTCCQLLNGGVVLVSLCLLPSYTAFAPRAMFAQCACGSRFSEGLTCHVIVSALGACVFLTGALTGAQNSYQYTPATLHGCGKTARGGMFHPTLLQVCNIASKAALCWQAGPQGQPWHRAHTLYLTSCHIRSVAMSLGQLSINVSPKECRSASLKTPSHPVPAMWVTTAVPRPGHCHCPSLSSHMQSVLVIRELQQGYCSRTKPLARQNSLHIC